jgi:hypothetical protein
MALKKYRLKNIAKGQTQLFSGVLGILSIPHLTDQEAEVLYQGGKSHYIELVPGKKSESK